MAEDQKSLAAKVAEAVAKIAGFRKLRDIADNRRHKFRTLVLNARSEGDTLQRKHQDALEGHHPQLAEQILIQLESVRKQEDRLHAKLVFWRKRYAGMNQRVEHWNLVWKHRKDRLVAWVKNHQTFQPYMANGNPYEKLTPEAQYAIYLDFKAGLYVTATYEGYPGDGVHSTTSGHYLQNQPDGRARCWDAASMSLDKMVTAQQREAKRCPSYMVELIGPENDLEFKNGIRYTLAEGDPLETMHDNHKHEWIRDGAPK